MVKKFSAWIILADNYDMKKYIYAETINLEIGMYHAHSSLQTLGFITQVCKNHPPLSINVLIFREKNMAVFLLFKTARQMQCQVLTQLIIDYYPICYRSYGAISLDHQTTSTTLFFCCTKEKYNQYIERSSYQNGQMNSELVL